MLDGGHVLRATVLSAGLMTILVLAGCATGLRNGDLGKFGATGDCRAVYDAIERHPEGYGQDDALLFAMDAAMTLMGCGDAAASQEWFREADRLGQALWTESLSRQAASLLTGDYILDYAGEDFERVMVNLMSALAFLEVGDLDGALVECRRLDSLLNVYNAKYDEKNVYSEDAFARYLSGLLYEDDGEPDDAFIAYLRAARIYKDYAAHYGTPMPRILEEDLRRMGSLVDREAEAGAALPAPQGDQRPVAWDTRGLGRVVYIQLAGHAPRKVSDSVIIPTAGGPLSVAFPRMIMKAPACAGGQMALRDGGNAIFSETALVEDINRIAMKNLADRRVRVIAKAVARAAAKQVVIHQIANSSDDPNTQEAIRAALNIVNLFVEQADTRSWQTLPGEIHMTRAYAAPGTYQAEISACGGVRTLPPVTVTAGRTRYIVDDMRYPAAAGRPQ